MSKLTSVYVLYFSRLEFLSFAVSLLLCGYITVYFCVTLIIRNGYDVLITLGLLETVLACLILSILILIHVRMLNFYSTSADVPITSLLLLTPVQR